MPPAKLLRLHRNSLMNVLVVGGEAAQRLDVARAFHRESAMSRGSLIEVDCRVDEAELLAALTAWVAMAQAEPGANPLRAAERGTLYLDHVEHLSRHVQRLLLVALRPVSNGDEALSEMRWGRLVVGMQDDGLASVADGRFSVELFDALDKVRVDLTTAATRGAA